MLFVVAIVAIILISLSVFGGGQVFMPMFKWLWELLANNFGINIQETHINQVFTVANATPGVVSTKFAFFTGLLVGNQQSGEIAWYGYLFMFLTYFFFCLPAILIMALAMKYITKFENKSFLKRVLTLMKPVVAGIIISVGLQLFIGVLLPFVKFNENGNYFKISFNNSKAHFFSGWRAIVLYIYAPLNVIVSWYLYRKKISLFILIIVNIVISLILFQPWLN
ncbi:chromate ion transporter [Mycoplasmopsis columbina SF7]|uniref:Chromate ion transporter n=1 Tax=Mycoplasmopsis columbina SF7 TaxID=1037410 RepID=F9UJI2_9BACT|nr:chromate transporter [Mycoplasmopsis columbina]EGV00363.1 chromate ion transporter [Mycoplasmopsis columbina SF7]